MELKEGQSIIVKGENLQYPDYFNENQVFTLRGQLAKCNKVPENDYKYILFVELKEILEQILSNPKLK